MQCAEFMDHVKYFFKSLFFCIDSLKAVWMDLNDGTFNGSFLSFVCVRVRMFDAGLVSTGIWKLRFFSHKIPLSSLSCFFPSSSFWVFWWNKLYYKHKKEDKFQRRPSEKRQLFCNKRSRTSITFFIIHSRFFNMYSGNYGNVISCKYRKLPLESQHAAVLLLSCLASGHCHWKKVMLYSDKHPILMVGYAL